MSPLRSKPMASTIHKGKLNGTPVAIKKIFDPRLTDELLQEIQNEIVM